jgi:hypothetical protein
MIKLPVIAFDYQGRLVASDGQGRPRVPEDFVIPIVKGSIIYPQELEEKEGTLEPAEVIETPKGNYTNNPVIRIDWLTGRARSMRPENVNYAGFD